MSSSAKSRNFRRRGDGVDDAHETDSVTPSPAPSTTGRKPAISSTSTKPPSSSKPKKLLSFVDDEEEGEAATGTAPKARGSSKPKTTTPSSRAPKPPTSSHKLTSSKDRLPSTLASTTSNVQPQAGTYTKEALLELQKNTRKLAKPSSAASSGGGSGSEPRIVLKGSLKPLEVEEVAKYEDEEEERESVVVGAREEFRGIPDEETIKKIRAKRERLRQARGVAPDYIPLEGGSALGGAIGGELSDDDGEEEEDAGLGGFGIGRKEKSEPGVFDVVVDIAGKGGLGSAPDKYVAGREELNGGDGDEDEEDKLWEEEQFRKALGKRMDDASGVKQVFGGNVGALGGVMVHNHQLQQQQQQQRSMAYGVGPSIGGAFAGYYGPDALSIPQQAEIAMKALQDSVTRLKESHGRTLTSLNKADENLSSSLMNITALEKSLSAAGEKFIFMQKLRDFVSVLCEFLQHKAPFIEELEEQLQKLHEQRASAVIERRSADDNDEMLEVEAAVKAAKLVLGEHGNSAAMIDAAGSAAQAAIDAVRKQSNLPVKLDEFGRDVNQQKRMDMKRRAEARQRRRTRKKLSSMDVDGLDIKVEGESSTDESDSETAAYESNHELLLQTADQIFSDASEEYSELLVVKERFERWKKEYSASYRDAYMALTAPAIFSPYVRLELLKWDPLHKNTDFFSMKWHALLFDYGMLEDSNTLDSNTGDADVNLVPELVEKVAIPILQHQISHCWDIYSTRQTENAVSATSSVINYIQTSSEALAELLVAIRSRLGDAVSALVVPTWNPLILKAVPSAGLVAAYRFGMSIRLLRSIGLWKDILALSVLEKLALDDVLCAKILPHIRSIGSNIHDAVTRTERVVASLSGVWVGPNARGNHRQKLQPLVDFVMLLGRTLEKKHLSGTTEAETSGLARRLKKMLVMLDDYDNARQIARTFHLKEAL